MKQKCTKCNEPHYKHYTCMQWKAQQNSIDISANHKPRKYCKEWQHCSKCCEIKHGMRILKHLSGECKKNKRPNKCPVCFYKCQTPYLSTGIEAMYKRLKKELIIKLYIMCAEGSMDNYNKRKYSWRYKL